MSDSAGAQVILDGIHNRWPWGKHLFADGAYDRLKLDTRKNPRAFGAVVIH